MPSSRKEYLHAFSDVEWESPSEHVRRKALGTGHGGIALIEYTKGHRSEVWCADGHTGFVVEGMLAIDFDKETLVCHEGWGFTIPPGDKHKVEPQSERVLVLLFQSPEAA